MSISINFNDQNKQNMPGLAVSLATSQKENEKKTTVFMGNLNIGKDPIKEKIESARKQAFKIVSDAYGADRDFDKQVGKIKDLAKEMKAEKAAAQEDKKAAEETIEGIKNEYSVGEDSKEQQDLEWLMNYRKGSLDERFCDPEQMKKDQARAAEIEANLTDYQSRMLEANKQLDTAQKRIDDADAGLVATRQSLTDAAQEKNKNHAMVDAQNEAEAIMDAAEKSVVGMVMNDAKDKIDEKAREEQEKAEEKKEEEEKQEKIEAERAEKKAIQEALAEGTKDAVQEAEKESRRREGADLDLTDVIGKDPTQRLENGGNVNAALDELKNKMALIDADLKGIKIDETV